MMADPYIDVFVHWFQSNGGYIDTNAMGITTFLDSGRGAVALNDIPEGHTLFTLPRTLPLSTRTSSLPSLFGLDAWHAHGLHKGWAGLILCMMWEDAWAHESDSVDEGSRDQGQERGQDFEGRMQTKWGPYMHILPTTFDTPIFWSTEELEELRGTAVIEKIGRDDAERIYAERLVPAIKTSPTLFPHSHHAKWYTVDAYHRAGSRILSRSFTVSRWIGDEAEVDEEPSSEGGAEETDEDNGEGENPPVITSVGSSKRIFDPCSGGPNEDMNSDSSDDEEDDPSEVAMVPMADILNARWGSENAKLFYEPLELRMITTRKIQQGEQIFNTYGDPPNSDLLRRYGHVDLVRVPFISSISMPDEHGDVEMKSDDMDTIPHLGNPSDIVEIRADLVVHTAQTSKFGLKSKDVHARIEWWLDEGKDDAFVVSLPESDPRLSAILPPEIISLVRLLILSEPDFESARSKGKLPKGSLVKGNVKDVLEILDEVFRRREGIYAGGSVEDDEYLLSFSETLTMNKRHAIVVRLGEKRILRNVRQVLKVTLAELGVPSEAGCGDESRDTMTDKNDVNAGAYEGSSKKRAANSTEGDRGRKRSRK